MPKRTIGSVSSSSSSSSKKPTVACCVCEKNIDPNKLEKHWKTDKTCLASLIWNPNHTPFIINDGNDESFNQSGYIRSSNTFQKNYQSTPLFDKTREPITIGAPKTTIASKGYNLMKHGFATTLSHRAKAMNEGTEAAALKLAGKAYTKTPSTAATFIHTLKNKDKKPYEKVDLTASPRGRSRDPKWNHTNSIERQREICGKLLNKNPNLTNITITQEHDYTCVGISVGFFPKPLGTSKDDWDKQEATWSHICLYLLLAIFTKDNVPVNAKSSFAFTEATVAECFQKVRLSPGLPDTTINLDDHVDALYKCIKKFDVLVGKFLAKHTANQATLSTTMQTIIKDIEHNQRKIVPLIESLQNGDSIKKALSNYIPGGITSTDTLTYENYNDHYTDPNSGAREDIFKKLEVALKNAGKAELYKPRAASRSPVRLQSAPHNIDIYSDKVILPSAMRAIVCAISSVFYIYENFGQKVDVSSMYFEVSDIMVSTLYKQVKGVKGKGKYGGVGVGKKKYILELKDINHLVTTSAFLPPTPATTSVTKVALIFDVTSCTAKDMAKVIRENLIDNVTNDFIILVSSGTKHSFGGLDIGQYGEMRIFSKEKELCERIVGLVRNHSNTPLLEFDHILRRHFKEYYELPTNKLILGLLYADLSSSPP